ncbi:sterile alpha motif domain-containing protein 3 isoform X1 [Anas platyrhynchos]|uniref:Sterile alpha motif domain containing 3 n=1 Tax=Anas platyrhynchos platyrhynchos TaxID=8840 RepID=U3IUC2_ANAPP|nr:sterile alpha motif domain-containing protein 3 [Anas platyrhynchos]XP_012952240.2 sterile alpha motif domain-containing protein 3 [Anas platyrhynchos]XP_038033524.1 sterile alpha motif domain-containing protein 3 [Anas platyrhynchos]|eukprot:XP_012952234.2 sterile alpha motif domain-containing protein 3 isoform X1 [Anas platyrhynchos]
MESWSVDQVCNWLRQRNLEELVPKFREEEVSGAALLALNDRMVQQLVKKIGHQAVLMDLINKYQQQKNGPEPFTYYCESASPILPAISGDTERQILSTFSPVEQKLCLSSTENEEGLIDQRVLKQKRNLRSCSAVCKMLHWKNSYTLPAFPYDVKILLAEKKCPDHSMRIRIIECLQADMTKYLAGSLYPNSQQYNFVVSALLQAYPFLDDDGNGFSVWKRALKDRFKYVRRTIEDDEQVLRNKCKFGHRRGQRRKSSSAENKPYDIKVLTEDDPAYLEGDAMYENINWLKQEYMKTQRNWNEVNNRMNATIQIRRKMISDKAPLQDILRVFPFLRCPYQLFREFQILTHMNIYQKTVEILEIYSENILSLYLVKNNPITIMLQENLKQHTEEDILKYMKMTAACLLLPDVFGDDSSLFAAVNEEVKVVTPVLEVKNPFNVNSCEFALYVEKQEVAQLEDCTTALAALVAAFYVFDIPCPNRIYRTLNFLESLVFEMRCPAFLPAQVKRGLEIPVFASANPSIF